METVINSFNFSDKEEIKNFFVYIFSNIEARTIVVKIFFSGTDEFICGIDPVKISEEQVHVGPEKITSRLPVCDHRSGRQILELSVKKISKIEILQP